MNFNLDFCSEVKQLLNTNYVILNEDEPQQPIPGVQELTPDQQDGLPQEGEPPMEEQEMNDPEMQDADYMMNPEGGMEGGQPPEPADPSDTRKKVHLYDNFDDLRKMTVDFYENLERIDLNLLNDSKLKYLKLVLESVKTLEDKIKEHMLYNYQAKEYEENLYIYMLLRAELLTNISLLRKTLGIRKK